MPRSASKQRLHGTGTGLVGSLTREKEHHREEADDRREAPKGTHGLALRQVAPERLGRHDPQHRADTQNHEGVLRQLPAGREPGDLLHYEFKAAVWRAPRRFGGMKELSVFIWHAPGMPEDG